MFTVYVLYSNSYTKIYVGFTANLEQRLLAHNEFSKNSYTTKFRPWKIIFIEKFNTKAEAMNREKQLKSQKGREFIWNFIKENNL